MQSANHPQASPARMLDNFGPDLRPPLTTAEPADLVVDGDHAVAWVSGEIDVSNAARLVELGGLAISDARVDALVIDVGQVTFMDSTGLGAMIQLRNQARAANKRLTLRAATPPVSKILGLTGLDEAFGLTADDAGRC